MTGVIFTLLYFKDTLLPGHDSLSGVYLIKLKRK